MDDLEGIIQRLLRWKLRLNGAIWRNANNDAHKLRVREVRDVIKDAQFTQTLEKSRGIYGQGCVGIWTVFVFTCDFRETGEDKLVFSFPLYCSYNNNNMQKPSHSAVIISYTSTQNVALNSNSKNAKYKQVRN